jgi:hypothetical protein
MYLRKAMTKKIGGNGVKNMQKWLFQETAMVKKRR